MPAIADVGSTIDGPAFWACIGLIVGLAFGTWLGTLIFRALVLRLADENAALRTAHQHATHACVGCQTPVGDCGELCSDCTYAGEDAWARIQEAISPHQDGAG